ncbi:MAG: cryptochrome/photolyase family protein [Phycisphaerales bacterium]|nr:cryptochrome/photolyase family protein [Phycisphaerales bacterium]
MYLVLGDQLNHGASWLGRMDRRRDHVVMMEVAEESRHVPSHRQRTVLFLSAMRHFAAELEAMGCRVWYARLEDPQNTRSFPGEVARAAAELRPERIVVTEPGEHRVAAMVPRWERDAGCPVQVMPDEHFLTSREQFAEWAAGRKELTMEYFYRAQRRRLGVLVQPDGEPVGGVWNLDKENREAFGEAPKVRPPRAFPADATTGEVIAAVERHLPGLYGRVSAESWRWPVTRAQALEALDDFVRFRLSRFGPFEDAMWTGEPFLYHSVLSPLLNLKLLDPRECVDAAVRAFESGRAPLQSVEGFVRQIIGWREFVRGVYFHEGPGYGDRNYLGHTGRLPAWYWDGNTDMNCLRQCLGQVVEHGYSHHIPRLMVMGNFALIAGVNPRQVSDWFLGMYVDGVDWATLPNALGMSQHADARPGPARGSGEGGRPVVGTKPYAASANYIGKMSDYCRGCRYDPASRTGERACPFNTFYWDFLIRHRERLRKNTRMAMILKNVDRLDPREITRITVSAAARRKEMGIA